MVKHYITAIIIGVQVSYMFIKNNRRVLLETYLSPLCKRPKRGGGFGTLAAFGGGGVDLECHQGDQGSPALRTGGGGN